MWNFLLAIDSIGPADLIVLESEPDGENPLPAALPQWSVEYVPIERRRPSHAIRIIEMLRGDQPSTLSKLDIEQAARSVRALAMQRRLIVAIQPIAAVVALRAKETKTRLVVDLWDVEDARLASVRATSERTRPNRLTRRLWDVVRDKSDIRAWRAFHQRLVTEADAVTVCSHVDREAMPHSSRIWVVPNGADVRPGQTRPRPEGPPVVLYHGQLTYAPNIDAARVLVREVFPLLRREVPDVRIRLVGRVDERVQALHSPPDVVVTGLVDNIEPELDRASLLIVPLRSGGGTRLKILEAFAARLPVVSTAIGAEGLDVESGRHLLIADDPPSIAACGVELLHDDSMRRHMTDEAFKLVSERYDWRIIRADLAQRLRALI